MRFFFGVSVIQTLGTGSIGTAKILQKQSKTVKIISVPIVRKKSHVRKSEKSFLLYLENTLIDFDAVFFLAFVLKL